MLDLTLRTQPRRRSERSLPRPIARTRSQRRRRRGSQWVVNQTKQTLSHMPGSLSLTSSCYRREKVVRDSLTSASSVEPKRTQMGKLASSAWQYPILFATLSTNIWNPAIARECWRPGVRRPRAQKILAKAWQSATLKVVICIRLDVSLTCGPNTHTWKPMQSTNIGEKPTMMRLGTAGSFGRRRACKHARFLKRGCGKYATTALR